MIHVKQTRGYEGKDYRGNCFTACVASLFEIPLEGLPDFTGKQNAALTDWLNVHYPGVIVRSREHEPFDADGKWPVGLYPPHGFWMATVESPRFTEECTRHTAPGGNTMPPHWYDLPDCPFCHGTGTRQGFHLVVCKSGKVVHDPSPEVGGYGWEYNGRLSGATWFEVSDPGRLLARTLPL